MVSNGSDHFLISTFIEFCGKVAAAFMLPTVARPDFWEMTTMPEPAGITGSGI